MRFYEIINEYDQSATVNNFGQKLVQRYQRDRDTQFTKDDPELAAKIVGYLEGIDPTKKKSFTKNLCRWYADGSMRYLEDATKAIDPMNLYVKFKNRLSGVSLNTMTFDAFLDLGSELEGTKSGKEQDKSEEQAFFDTNQASLFYNDNNVKIVIPKTKEASIYFGRNTKWCTAAKNNNMFDSYAGDGPLYIVLFKKENVRWQLHFESGQFMDEQDRPIEPSLIRNNELIQKLFGKKFLESALDEDAVFDDEDDMAYVNGADLPLDKALKYARKSRSIIEPHLAQILSLSDKDLIKTLKKYPWVFGTFPEKDVMRIPADLIDYIFESCLDKVGSWLVMKPIGVNCAARLGADPVTQEKYEDLLEDIVAEIPFVAFAAIKDPSPELQMRTARKIVPAFRGSFDPDPNQDVDMKKALKNISDPQVVKYLTSGFGDMILDYLR